MPILPWIEQGGEGAGEDAVHLSDFLLLVLGAGTLKINKMEPSSSVVAEKMGYGIFPLGERCTCHLHIWGCTSLLSELIGYVNYPVLFLK